MERIAPLIVLFVILARVAPAQPFSLDTTFNPTYAFVDDDNKNYTGYIADFYEEADGRLMLVGAFADEPKTKRARWVRLHPDGGIDYSWNPNTSLVDGKNILARLDSGYFVGDSDGLFETNFSGTILTSYPGIPLDSAFNCNAFGYPYVFEDGSFLAGIGGCAYPHPGNVQRIINFMRVGTDGYVDTSFHHHANDQVGRTYPYDSTRILCYGNWVTEYDGIPVNRVFRIFKDGTLDTTFQVSQGFSRMGYPIHVQEDGKVILGWNYALRGSDTLTLFRLHPNGDFDSTFNFQSTLKHPYWPVGNIISVCATSDGGYLFGGVFSEFDGYRRNNIVKTDGDGWIDTLYLDGLGVDSVKSGLGFPPAVNKIVPGQNDTYYVMGKFLMFDGQPVKPIIRLLGLSHTVGLEEELKPKHLKVYPNPASGEVTFAWQELPGFDAAVIRLLDLQGRLLAEQNWPAGVQEYTIQLPEYSGTVLYEVESGEVVTRGKLVVR